MRWNPNRAADLLSTGRTVLSDMAARTVQHGMRQTQILPPAAPQSLGAPLIIPDDEEEQLVDDWLKLVSRPAPHTCPAPPGDFTACVMARLEAGTVVASQPIPRARSRATIVEHLCVVGGVFGVSILLVVTTCVLTALLAPNVVFVVLNALVGAVVTVLLLLSPLVDALNALVANPPLMCALLALVAGALALWSRVLHPAASLTGEA